MFYKMDFERENGVLKIGFGDPASNHQIVLEAAVIANGLEIDGTPILKINGPASLPVAMVIAHSVCHRVGAVACYDPKLGQYVVCISHNPSYSIGDLID